MDIAQVRREFAASLRLLVAEERRLLGGAVAVAVAYAVWVSATGAALNFGLDFGEQPTSVAAWQATGTAALALVVVLWVVVPAAAVTYLLDRAVTNANGNVHQHYRFNHPFLLVAPFLLLFVAGLGAAVALGTLPAAAVAAMSAVGLFALVRTVPASYRVFSLSRPRLAEALLFLALCVDAVAIPVSAATLTGRRATVDAAATGLGRKLGSSAVETLLVGATTAGDVTVANLLAATALVPVALVLLYFGAQVAVAAFNRIRSPDVPRSHLRADQRYPEFARPVQSDAGNGQSTDSRTRGPQTAKRDPSNADGSSTSGTATAPSPSGGSASPSTAATSAPAGSGSGAGTTTGAAATDADTSEADEDEEFDDGSHTRVFKPPAGGGFDDDVDDGSGAETDGGYRCPSCDDRFGADASFEYCPTCGSELEEE